MPHRSNAGAPNPGLSVAAGLALAFIALSGGPGHAGAPVMPPGQFAGPRLDAGREARRGADALAAGAYREAEDAFRHVTELTPNDADAWDNLGDAASGLGETKTAVYAYGRSVALDRTSIGARRDLAVALIKMKQAQKASAQLAALKARAAACKESCPQADELKAAIATVENALSN